jgi:hypothetical protein
VDKQSNDLVFANKIGFYNRELAESPDEVARKTVEGMKKGEFLVTTTGMAYLISILARGFIPSDSLVSFAFELALLIPVKIASFVWLHYVKHVIRTGETVP